jgi:hypothetical protein
MDRRRKESAFILKCKKKQILRYSTPATAKTAVAGDPGFHPNEPSLVGDPGSLRMTLMKRG